MDVKPLTVNALSRWLKKDRATLVKAIDNNGLEPVEVKGRAKYYYLADIVTALLKDGGLDLQQERAKLAVEQTRKLQRENDIEDNLVAPVSLLTFAIEKAGKQIIPILESLPLEMKRYFPELTGDQIQIVKTAIAKCRNTIADMELDLDEKQTATKK